MMSKQQEKLKGRLEQMLRRWGVEEAARMAPTVGVPRIRRGPPAWVRWGPLVAAAVLLLAAAGLFLATRLAPTGDAGRPADVQGTLKQLEAEHAETVAALRRAEAELGKLRGAAAAVRRQLTAAEEHRQALGKLQAQLDQRNAQLKELTKLLGTTRDLNARIEDDRVRLLKVTEGVEEKIRQVEQKVAAAAEELQRSRKLFEAAEAARRKAENELALMKVHRSAMMSYFQQAYLASAGSREGVAEGEVPTASGADAGAAGLWARQEVARRSRLIRRCARIRTGVQDGQTRDLLDKLEVVLTQLEILDVRDAASVQAFCSTVRDNELPKQIDQALTAGREDSAVRSWLFEALLILTGADRVG